MTYLLLGGTIKCVSILCPILCPAKSKTRLRGRIDYYREVASAGGEERNDQLVRMSASLDRLGAYILMRDAFERRISHDSKSVDNADD